jgi:diguanylate cyclase (GGDEF)-like protein
VATASRHWWQFYASTRPGVEPDLRKQALPAERRFVSPEEDLTAALDLVARAVRLVGEVPVVPDEPKLDVLRDECEAWALHLLTRTEPPDAVSPPPGQRAWKGVTRFLVDRRHAEQELVATSLAELRQAVVVIAKAVRGSLVSEKADTRALLEAVGSLQVVASDGSLAELRDEVRRAASQLRGMSAERDARQRDLSDRVTLLSGQVEVLVEEVREAQQLAMTDALTGLLNRTGFEAAARRGLALSVPAGRSLSLALIDLDDLKWVNDQHGHAAGDAAIRALANSLRAICRTSDHIARIGGDEFAAILIDADGLAAERIVGRFLQELWSRNIPASLIGAEPIRVSASVGIAQAVSNDTLVSWTERADRWMYRAKGLGKNRVLGDGLQAGTGPDGLPDNR